MSGAAPSEIASGVPTGNTFDKYGSGHPVVRRLMAGFVRALDELVAIAAPASVLDVGCGEGVLTARLAGRVAGGGSVVGVDLEDAGLRAHWAARSASLGALCTVGETQSPSLRFDAMPAESLRFDAGTFELVCATEVLEHVADPDLVVAEMARVSARWLLVSVPREPLWRALNVARGAYLRELGNTPGHVQHFSAAGIRRLVAGHGEIVAVRSPLPWTMLLARVG